MKFFTEFSVILTHRLHALYKTVRPYGVDVKLLDAKSKSARPTLVFLHGAGLNRAMWLPQIRELGKDFPVLAIDLPGHGELIATPFTLEAAVAHTAQAIARENCARVVTVGLSLGGYVAIAHAAKHPEQVAGLVLSGCCVQYFGIIKLAAKMNILLSNFVSDQGFETMQQRMICAVAETTVCEEIARAGFSRSGVKNGMKEVIGKNFAAMLHNCCVPILIVNGERDTLNRMNEKIIIAAADNAVSEVINDSGHLCSLERPEEFSSVVRQFSERIQA